jgi:hypothetical protein
MDYDYNDLKINIILTYLKNINFDNKLLEQWNDNHFDKHDSLELLIKNRFNDIEEEYCNIYLGKGKCVFFVYENDSIHGLLFNFIRGKSYDISPEIKPEFIFPKKNKSYYNFREHWKKIVLEL